MIKVLSRTLFVGGVTSSEAHLRSLFSAFGIVQTCIVNTDKRHAFVKMINRQDAVKARDGMEQYKSGDMQLRTRWGVGFGPRDCSDYQTGISIIPVDRLTDADRKWMLTAEYGGTGGRPIEPGMVVEEPDIEIGAGVSSKGKHTPFHLHPRCTISILPFHYLICHSLLGIVSFIILSTAISRRMATDQGGKRGPQSSRGDNHGSSRSDGRNRFRNGYDERDRDRDSSQRDVSTTASSNPNPNTIGVPPPVPGYSMLEAASLSSKVISVDGGALAPAGLCLLSEPQFFSR